MRLLAVLFVKWLDKLFGQTIGLHSDLKTVCYHTDYRVMN